MRAWVKVSKSDPLQAQYYDLLGSDKYQAMPCKAILAYIAVRGSKPGPLFMFANQQGLTRDKLVSHLRVALTEVGINPDLYAGHSFRTVAATVVHMKCINPRS